MRHIRGQPIRLEERPDWQEDLIGKTVFFFFQSMTGEEIHHHVDNWYSDIIHESIDIQLPHHNPLDIDNTLEHVTEYAPDNEAHDNLVITNQQMADGTFWEYRNDRD